MKKRCLSNPSAASDNGKIVALPNGITRYLDRDRPITNKASDNQFSVRIMILNLPRNLSIEIFWKYPLARLLKLAI
jgi:hypothetical protein